MALVAGGPLPGSRPFPGTDRVDVIDSVAVLPFENVGGDPDDEYLSDGIADTLIDVRLRLPNLRVIRAQHELSLQGQRSRPTKRWGAISGSGRC